MPNPEAPRIDRRRKHDDQPPADRPRIEVPLPPPPTKDAEKENKLKRGVETIDISGDGTPDARDEFSADQFSVNI
ncbi:MAG: hypothetical protein HYT15_01370 [Candidatus Magasanikbacteria bacterium]|nr:hypothetical protein [Candidatus Magasanikbacteria bacterium]